MFPLAVCGVTNLPAPGPPTREIPLLFRRRAEVLPSFTLVAVGQWMQLAPGEISAQPGRAVRLGEQTTIAIDRFGNALLDSAQFDAVNRIGLDDLLLLTNGQSAATPAAAAAAARMKDGLVILGRTDHAAQVCSLPSGRRASPAEVLAWAAQSLRQRPGLRRAGLGWDAGLTVAIAWLGTMLLRVSRRRTFAIAAGALAVYALGALCAYQASGLWLPCALPVGLMACLCACRFLPRGEEKESGGPSMGNPSAAAR